MTFLKRLKKASTPQARAMLFKAALAMGPTATTPASIARECQVSGAMVTRVLQWKAFGGVKVHRIQEAVAAALGVPAKQLFPERGPAIAGGGFQAQKRNWSKSKS